ncbi:calcium-binding protein [Streptomyces sp. NPDC048419]|uniref:calcium-binding protein n=1 Tax=Streptomyces sp. NPDC048419 TaxID=3365547 RepID=UPI00371A0E8E
MKFSIFRRGTSRRSHRRLLASFGVLALVGAFTVPVATSANAVAPPVPAQATVSIDTSSPWIVGQEVSIAFTVTGNMGTPPTGSVTWSVKTTPCHHGHDCDSDPITTPLTTVSGSFTRATVSYTPQSPGTSEIDATYNPDSTSVYPETTAEPFSVTTQALTCDNAASLQTAPAGYTLVRGTSGNNVLNGTDGNDIILGNGGNDAVNGMGGDDLVCTGDGNDVIITGNGNDQINAGDGNNFIRAGDGDNNVNSGRGNDVITTGSGNDTVSAGNGNNAINVAAGDDHVTAGTGNDVVNAGAGDDTVDAGAGHNIVIGAEH